MRIVLGTAGALALLAFAGCSGKPPEPHALPEPPRILSFTADRTRIEPGESVTLSFTTANANSAALEDGQGQSIPLQGDASAGTATVSPTSTSVYVLRIKGDGGRDNGFVQVGVGEDLGQVFFAAVPTVMDSGDTAQLLWSAPHAKAVTIRSASGTAFTVDASKGSGVQDVTPDRTETYSLTAERAVGDSLQATAELQVRPVLQTFDAQPQAAMPGETIALSWKTRGAAEVVVSEATFGELFRAKASDEVTSVDHGNFQWTVPETLPSGAAPLEGQPLHFQITVTQSHPAVTLTRSIDGWIGHGPKIVDFHVPPAVTEGKQFQVTWDTANAVRVQLFADGALIYEPLAGTPAIAHGALSFPAPTQAKEYELVAYSFTGARASQKQTIHPVQPPVINTFTLPLSVTSAGDAARAEWTTSNATSIDIRVKNGPTVYSSEEAARVASGNTSLYPGLRTTFVFEAWNEAGDEVTMEATTDVSSPGNVTVSPLPAAVGDPVTVNWTFDSNLLELSGDPSQFPLRNNPDQFYDDLETEPLSRRIAFADPSDAVTQLELAIPFRFPFAGLTVEKYWVSTNGFVSFAPAGALPNNADLASATDPLPPMLAPFWDDLTLDEQSEVLYEVQGTIFPRRLIIQWNKVHTAADPTSELTFQVQLLESGEFRFIYKTLAGTDSGGENATIGWRRNASLAGSILNAGGPVLSPDDEIDWFANGLVSNSVTFSPRESGEFTLVEHRANGHYVIYPARLNVLAPGSVQVNEAMVLPDASATDGQWVELSNETDGEIDLSGAVLSTTSTGSTWTLPEGSVIPARGYLVVGQSSDPLANGDASVQLVWSGLTPNAAAGDTLTLGVGTTVLSSLTYGAQDISAGQSINAPEKLVLGSGVTLTCSRTQTFGSNGAIGTPGAANELCFDYRRTAIPVSYEDISSTGTPLFSSSSSMDSDHVKVDLSSAPFPWFGVPQATWTVNSNGFLAPGDQTATGTGNKTTPSTTSPNGTLAVFWDDLAKTTTTSDPNAYLQRMSGYWIVQWHHFRYWNANPQDDMNFEAKLFDDGTVEFHYATMASGTSSHYAEGTSATSWVERPAGDAASAIGINSSFMKSNVAWRFTPKAPVLP